MVNPMADAKSKTRKSPKRLKQRMPKLHRFEALIETAAVPIVALDKQGHIKLFNRYCEEITGYNRNEVLGKSFFTLLIPESLQEDAIRAFKGVFKGEPSSHIGTEWKTKDGEIRIIELHLTPITEKGKMHDVLGICIDITERKQAQEILLRTNRALRVLSLCNETLVRATDESTLLQEVCKTLIETGGYRFAWVGYAESDAAKTVRPVAFKGFENGYLKTLNITWADTTRGRGPVGIAIRTGKPQIAKNIITDPSLSPWRAEAIARGYASLIALPLHSNNQTIGTLTIYSASTDAFNPEEVYLLEQLTNDLAYGIFSLRAKAELKSERDKAQMYLDVAGFMFVVLDTSGKIILINQKGCEILNYTESVLLGKNWFDTCIPKLLRKEVKSVFKKLMTGEIKPVEYYENPVVTKNGEERLISWHNTVLRNEKGDIIGTLSSGEDITEQNAAAERLKQSEASLAEAQRIANMGNWDWNIITNELLWSDEIYRIFGLKPQEFGATYDAFLESVHPDDREFVKSSVNEALYENKPYSIDHRIVLPDGIERVVHEKAEVTFDKAGKPIRMIGTVQDITERWQMEEHLQYLHNTLQAIRNVNQLIVRERNREKLLKKACDILVEKRSYYNAWIVLVDEDGSFKTATSAFIDEEFQHIVQEMKQGKLSYCTKKAFKKAGIHIIQISETCTDCPVAKQFHDKCALTTRLAHQDRVNGILTVSVPREMIGEEEISLFREVAEDISYALYLLDIEEEQAQGEQALKVSEARYRSLFNAVPIGLYRTSPDGKILEVNSAMVHLVGAKNREDLIAINAAKFFVDKETREQEISLLKQNGIVHGFEARFRRLDGRIIWVRDSARVIKRPDGTIQYYQGSLEDITEKKEAEAGLREARHRAEFLVDLMGHDLTNINQGLMSSLELLLYNPDLHPQLREAVEIALAQVERSAQLIDNVKRFQSFEENMPTLGSRDLHLALTAAIEAARRSFPNKRLELNMKLQEGEHFVLADGLLVEVFFNILHNAIKFDSKEKVIIDVLVGRSRRKGFLRIQIKDRGPGITNEEKDKILTRFIGEQGVYGWGIGLVLVQQIVDRYGGKIWVSDRVKGDHTQGANFNIEIPVGIENGNDTSR